MKHNAKTQQILVDNWNATWPVGTSVTVRMDDGTIINTKTNTPAQMLSGHTAVIWLAGVTGAYSLERVAAMKERKP